MHTGKTNNPFYGYWIRKKSSKSQYYIILYLANCNSIHSTQDRRPCLPKQSMLIRRLYAYYTCIYLHTCIYLSNQYQTLNQNFNNLCYESRRNSILTGLDYSGILTGLDYSSILTGLKLRDSLHMSSFMSSSLKDDCSKSKLKDDGQMGSSLISWRLDRYG